MNFVSAIDNPDAMQAKTINERGIINSLALFGHQHLDIWGKIPRGGSDWILGKGSSLRGWPGTGKAVTAPGLLEFKKHLDNSLKQMVCFLGGPLWSLELDSSVLVGSFQLQYTVIL